MRYNAKGYQKQAREIAETRGPVYGLRWQLLRQENARRAAAARH